MTASVEGMVSLRGQLVPVIDLAKYTGIVTETKPDIMIVTEYNGHTQGFLVEAVDTILRLDWSLMRVPPEMISNRMGGLVTAVTELNDQTLVMMIDVERCWRKPPQIDDSYQFVNIEPVSVPRMVFYADDSAVARKQIERTLDAMGIRHAGAINGRQAWENCNAWPRAEMAHRPLNEMLHLVLTDVEMPEMDGYILTKMIKTDIRFAGIPVLMHSSLSGHSNQKLGQSVGVDEYVSKFEPHNWPRKCASCSLDAPQSTLLPSGQAHPAARLTPFTWLKIGLEDDRFRRFAACQHRCPHQAGRLQQNGDPAVHAGHPRNLRHQCVQSPRSFADSGNHQDAQYADGCARVISLRGNIIPVIALDKFIDRSKA